VKEERGEQDKIFESESESDESEVDPNFTLMMKMLEQKNAQPTTSNSTLVVVISAIVVLMAVLFTIVLTVRSH